MMYCNTCGKMFDERQNERPWPEYGYMCPECGEFDDLEEAGECAHCGNYFKREPLSGGLCKECREEAKSQYRAFWSKYAQEFKDFVIDTDYHPVDEEIEKYYV